MESSRMRRPRLVVLISGRGSNLQAIIDAIAARRLDAELAGVISNEPDAAGLARAAGAGVDTQVVAHRDFSDRAAFEAALADCIDAYAPDVIALAGFMRVLSGDFVRRYLGRMLNIHPSLLPKFRGLHTHRRALEAGEREHGASVHFVTEELDGGPVIVQARVPVLPGDDEETLARRVLQQEHRIYPLAIGWVGHGRVRYRDGAVWMDGRALDAPVQYRPDQPELVQ